MILTQTTGYIELFYRQYGGIDDHFRNYSRGLLCGRTGNGGKIMDFFGFEAMMEVVKYGVKSTVVIICLSYIVGSIMSRKGIL